MTVLRHYFISDSLDELEIVEKELENLTIETPQIHVLSLDESGVRDHRHLHSVTSFMKTDVIRSGELGALVGAILAPCVVGLAYLMGWTETAAGWMPFILLGGLIFGFCTWEGGFIGVQRTNKHFRRFKKMLKEGKHVFFVDLLPAQEGVLEKVIEDHPGLELAGTRRGTPNWLMKSQNLVPEVVQDSFR